MKGALIALLLLSTAHCGVSTSQRMKFEKGLKAKLERFRNLEIVDGKFQHMQPNSPDESQMFDKIDTLATQKQTAFASNADNFQGNDLVSDKTYRIDVNKRPFAKKADPFRDPKEPEEDEEPEVSAADLEGEAGDESTDEGLLKVAENQKVISIDGAELSKKITDFHQEVVECLNHHEREESYHEMSFEEIQDDCLGARKMILRRFYNNIEFLTKQFLIHQIKNLLNVGACDDDLTICVEYLRAIQLTAELGLDVEQTTLANAEYLAKTLGEAKINFLFKMSKSIMKDYKKLVNLLAKEKSKLLQILSGKIEDYNTYSRYKPFKKDDDSSSRKEESEEEYQRLGGRLPADFAPDEDSSDHKTWDAKIEIQAEETKKKVEVVHQDTEFLNNSKTQAVRGKPPVNFPESSEELDKVHLAAHDLIAFKNSEAASLPVTSNVFKKE